MTETLLPPASSPTRGRVRRPAPAPARGSGGRRPARRRAERQHARGARTAPLSSTLRACAAGTLGAVLLGLVAVEVVVLLAWATDARAGSGAAAALRVGGAVWLSGARTRLTAGPVTVVFAPLGLTLCQLALLARAAGRAAPPARHPSDHRQPSWRSAARTIVPAVTLLHGGAAAGVALATRSPALQPDPWSALAGGAFLGAAGAAVGLARARHRAGAAPVLHLLPRPSRSVAAGALASGLGLVVAASLLAGAATVLTSGTSGRTTAALVPGAVGGAALLLLQVALAPDAVLWGVGWLAGPGFGVGLGSAVSPWVVTSPRSTLGLPLLAAVPHTGGGAQGGLSLAVVLGAGVLGGVVARRRGTGAGAGAGPLRSAARAAAVGPCVGLLAALACLVAGGSVGGGGLAVVGPSPWRVGLALAAQIALPAAVTAAGLSARAAWRSRRTEARGEVLVDTGGSAVPTAAPVPSAGAAVLVPSGRSDPDH